MAEKTTEIQSDDRAMICRKSEHSDDWYVVEWAEHDGREWMETMTDPIPHSAFRRSARVSDAEVEGTREEMLALANAIEDGGQVSFKRCAVAVDGDDVSLWSPRNSREPQRVSLVAAQGLARSIREVFASKVSS